MEKLSGFEVRTAILKIVADLGEFRGKLLKLGQAKAKTMADYDLAMKRAIVALKEKGEAATIIKDQAKGDCHQEKLDMEVAGIEYGAAVKNIEVLEASLNALQSIYRNLDEA
jgi:hypothetical protein